MSIQVISRAYGRMIRRQDGAPPVQLAQQYRTAKVEGMSLLSAGLMRPEGQAPGGSTGAFLDPPAGQAVGIWA